MSEPLDPKEAATLFYAGNVLAYVDSDEPPFVCGQWQGERAYITRMPFDEAGAEGYFTENPVVQASSLKENIGPPVLVDAPHAQQAGETLSCTQGNWVDPPAASKTYQWRSDEMGMEGETASTYTLIPDDDGHSFDCIVTATNPFGSTWATSNSVVVAAPSRSK
jgi:hypothetical protein